MDTATAVLAGVLARPKSAQVAAVPASLHRVDRAFAQRQYRRVNGVALGDSLFEGRNASAYRKSLVPQLLDALRAAFATSGQGGSGVSGGLDTIPAAWSIKGVSGTPQDCIPTTTGTVTDATGSSAALGMGRRSSLLAANATMTVPAVRCTGFDIEFAKGITPSGATFTYSIDGGTPVSVSSASTRANLTVSASVGNSQITVDAVPSDWRPNTELRIETGGNIETAFIASINGLVVTLKANLTLVHASGQPVAAHSNGGYLSRCVGSRRGCTP